MGIDRADSSVAISWTRARTSPRPPRIRPGGSNGPEVSP